ncbi:MAG: glyoxylate reductase [Gaiellales bacterium]|nr:glyoxylate reductase [Gaiellales bacterium]
MALDTGERPEGENVTDVLYIVQQGNVEPWLTDFREAAEGRFTMALLDHGSDIAPQFRGVSVVVDQGGHATREMIDAGAAAGVRLWQVIGTGLDHTDVQYILASGIQLANTPGQFSAVALAEHALLFILGLAKQLPEAARNCAAGIMYLPVSEELGGQVLGIVGLGASGRELARRARALGMRIQAVDVVPVPESELAELGVERFATLEGLDDLLATSDYVSLHVPLTDDTRHLLDGRRLRLMRPTSVLVNVARGRIVDEDALVGALRSGVIRGAGIDVFGEEPLTAGNPLLNLPNVISTPHTAGVTRGTSRRRSAAAIENAVRMLAGEEPLFRIAGPA